MLLLPEHEEPACSDADEEVSTEQEGDVLTDGAPGAEVDEGDLSVLEEGVPCHDPLGRNEFWVLGIRPGVGDDAAPIAAGGPEVDVGVKIVRRQEALADLPDEVVGEDGDGAVPGHIWQQLAAVD